MTFDTYKQFFKNESLIASLGQPSIYKDPGNVSDPICEKCGRKLSDNDPENSVYCENCYNEYCVDMCDYDNDKILDK